MCEAGWGRFISLYQFCKTLNEQCWSGLMLSRLTQIVYKCFNMYWNRWFQNGKFIEKITKEIGFLGMTSKLPKTYYVSLKQCVIETKQSLMKSTDVSCLQRIYIILIWNNESWPHFIRTKILDQKMEEFGIFWVHSSLSVAFITIVSNCIIVKQCAFFLKIFA